MSEVYGIDVSQFQGTPNWAQVRSARISGAPVSLVYVRSTYGPSVEDTAFAANWTGTAEAGLVHGAYHFALPSGNRPSALSASAQRQAAFFLESVNREGGITGADAPAVLDLEVTGAPGGPALDGAALTTWATAWLDDVNAAVGHSAVPALLYTNLNFWQTYLTGLSGQVQLWVADYGASPTVPHVGHQYTNRLSVAGITGAVDGDRFDAGLVPVPTPPLVPVVHWTMSPTRLTWQFTPPSAPRYAGWAQSVNHPAPAPAFHTAGGYFAKAWGPGTGATLYLTFFFGPTTRTVTHALDWASPGPPAPSPVTHPTGSGSAPNHHCVLSLGAGRSTVWTSERSVSG